jgi:hypothetical protein
VLLAAAPVGRLCRVLRQNSMLTSLGPLRLVDLFWRSFIALRSEKCEFAVDTEFDVIAGLSRGSLQVSHCN